MASYSIIANAILFVQRDLQLPVFLSLAPGLSSINQCEQSQAAVTNVTLAYIGAALRSDRTSLKQRVPGTQGGLCKHECAQFAVCNLLSSGLFGPLGWHGRQVDRGFDDVVEET